MVAAILAVMLAAQAQSPTVTARVDQTRLAVGEMLVYTVRATSRSTEPMQLTMAPVKGLQVVGRIERSELSGGTRSRAAVLELHLRAVTPGRWPIGPAYLIQGSDTIEARPVTVEVEAGRQTPAVTLSARIRRLLMRVPPPRGRPSISLVVSADSVRIGEQVDVVTAAWFPRDLRLRLRRPPMMRTPVIEQVWTAPQATPATIAASRTVGGVVHDLLVMHQIVFPLVAGPVTIPPATLAYDLPRGGIIFGRDERVTVQSRSGRFMALPLPREGRPDGFAGAVGTALQLERRVASRTATVGQAVTVDYAVSGRGNTALWPAPDVAWPNDVRAYRERVEDEISTDAAGVMGGRKTFRFLVVPDSAGVLQLPGVDYAYFDLTAGRYRIASVGAASLTVLPADSGVGTALPPPLLPAATPEWWWRLARPVPDWLWLALMGLPPLAIGLYSRRGRRRLPLPAAAPADALSAAELALDTAIASVVADPARREPRELAAALRAAGVDQETATAVGTMRNRIQAARYGPGGRSEEYQSRRPSDRGDERPSRRPSGQGKERQSRRPSGRGDEHQSPGPDGRDDERQLHREAEALAARLALASSRRAGSAFRGVISIIVMFGVSAHAQAQSPESLYAAGALETAVDGFARRAAAAPAVAAHWYGLGAAQYRLDRKGHAASAWTQARRLAPRNRTVRRALRLTPPPDPVSARRLWVPPARPEELLLVGFAGWILAWLGWVARPRLRDRWVVALVFSGLFAVAGIALRSWYSRPLAVADGTPELRLSPHGRARVLGKVEAGSAMYILRRYGEWTLVRTPGDQEGWLPADAVAPVGG